MFRPKPTIQGVSESIPENFTDTCPALMVAQMYLPKRLYGFPVVHYCIVMTDEPPVLWMVLGVLYHPSPSPKIAWGCPQWRETVSMGQCLQLWEADSYLETAMHDDRCHWTPRNIGPQYNVCVRDSISGSPPSLHFTGGSTFITPSSVCCSSTALGFLMSEQVLFDMAHGLPLFHQLPPQTSAATPTSPSWSLQVWSCAPGGFRWVPSTRSPGPTMTTVAGTRTQEHGSQSPRVGDSLWSPPGWPWPTDIASCPTSTPSSTRYGTSGHHMRMRVASLGYEASFSLQSKECGNTEHTRDILDFS